MGLVPRVEAEKQGWGEGAGVRTGDCAALPCSAPLSPGIRRPPVRFPSRGPEPAPGPGFERLAPPQGSPPPPGPPREPPSVSRSPSPARPGGGGAPAPAHRRAQGEPRASTPLSPAPGAAHRRPGREGGLGSPEEGRGRAAAGAGEGRAGLGGTRRGRAGLSSPLPPLQSGAAGGGTRDRARRRRARRGPRTIRGRSAFRAAPAASHRPPAAPEPQRRAAARGPGPRGAGSPHASGETGCSAPSRGLGRGGTDLRSLRPAEGEPRDARQCGGCGGAVCLGTEASRFAKVEGPSRLGLCRSLGASRGSTEYPSPRRRWVPEGCETGQPGSPTFGRPSLTPPLP